MTFHTLAESMAAMGGPTVVLEASLDGRGHIALVRILIEDLEGDLIVDGPLPPVHGGYDHDQLCEAAAIWTMLLDGNTHLR